MIMKIKRNNSKLLYIDKIENKSITKRMIASVKARDYWRFSETKLIIVGRRSWKVDQVHEIQMNLKLYPIIRE